MKTSEKKSAKYVQVRKLRITVVVFSLLIFGISRLSAQGDPYTQLTDDMGTESELAMEEDYIVYANKSPLTAEFSIVLYSISSGDTTIIAMPDHEDFNCLDISGDRIIWSQKVNGQWDIYNYLISRPDLGAYPLISNVGDQFAPALHEDMLVWVNTYNGKNSIYMYDIGTATTTQITSDADYTVADPDVYGNYIVWSDRRDGNSDIFMYSIFKEEETQLTKNDYDQIHPSIYEYTVVWEDYRNYNADIYLHYILYYLLYGGDAWDYNHPVFTGGIGEIDRWNQSNPKIYGDLIVYQDFRNYTWDIYYATFINPIVAVSQPVVNESRSQTNPVVWGNKVIWEDDREYSGSGFPFNNVWMWEKPPGVDLSLNIKDDPDPVSSGSEFEYLCFVSNYGDQSAYHPLFTFTLPNAVEFVSLDGFGAEGYTRSGDDLIFYMDSIPAHTTDSVIVKVRSTVETTLTAVAVIAAEEEDINETNNVATCVTEVIWLIPTYIDKGGQVSIAAGQAGGPHFAYLTNSWNGMLKYARTPAGSIISRTLDSSEYCNSPAIAIDDNNMVHIAYSRGSEGDPSSKQLCYVTNVDGGFGEAEIIADNVQEGHNVCIRVDKNNNPHVSCMRSLWGSDDTEYYIRNESWSKVHTISSTYNSAYFDLDTSDHAHFVYYNLASCGLCYSTNSPDGNWSQASPPDDDWQGGQMESLVCDISVDNESNPHVSYVGAVSSGENEDYKYAVNRGSDWTETTLEDGYYYGGENNIDTDYNGNPHITFNNPANDKLRYTWREDDAWHKKTIALDIFNNPGSKAHDIAMDRNGSSHITYVKDDKIYYVSNREPIPVPEISVSPQELDFFGFIVGDTSLAKTAILENTGDGDLYINDVRIGWPDSLHFSISKNTCSIVDPGDTCSVEVKFNPQNMGNKHALLWIDSNDPQNSTTHVDLKGEGLDGLLYSYCYPDFGDVVVGDSAFQEVKLKNGGNTYLIVQGLYLQEGDADEFFFRDLEETYFRIDEGDSLMFKIVFKPLSEGEKTCNFRVYSSGGEALHSLLGSGYIPTYYVGGEIRLPSNELVDEGWVYVRNRGNEYPEFYWYAKPLEGAVSFMIGRVPQTDVTVYFDPDETAYPGYIKTYLGDKAFFEEAEILSMSQDIDDILITLLEAPPEGGGSSDVSGSVSEGGGKKGTISMSQSSGISKGNALDSVSVFLITPEGTIAHADVSDTEGEFDFSKLETGKYLLKVDFDGIPMAEDNDTLIVTRDNQKFNILAVIGTNEISAEISELSSSPENEYFSKIEIYPNPFDERICIRLNEESNNLSYQFIDLSGRIVKIGNLEQGSGAKEQIEISTSQLESGMYSLKIYNKDYSRMFRLIKMK